MGQFTVNNKIIVPNSITQEGLKEAFRVFLTNADPLGDLYVGLIDSSGFTTAYDRFSDKSWTEFTDYCESTRPVWQRDSVVGTTVPNKDCRYSAFTLTSDVTIGALFITDDPTKGGLTGNILAVSDEILLQFYAPEQVLLQYEWVF